MFPYTQQHAPHNLTTTGSYSVGMFFAGHLGDRLDLRLFLTVGMLGSALFVSLFGMAYFWNIHNILYFVFVSVIAGGLGNAGVDCTHCML